MANTSGFLASKYALRAGVWVRQWQRLGLVQAEMLFIAWKNRDSVLGCQLQYHILSYEKEKHKEKSKKQLERISIKESQFYTKYIDKPFMLMVAWLLLRPPYL